MSIRNICVDLDGTLAKYDKWRGIDHIGEPLPGAQEMMVRIHEAYRIIIFTTRTNFELNHEDAKVPRLGGQTDEDYKKHCIAYFTAVVQGWLDLHDIPYDEIWTGQGKPIAEYYVDDRSIRCVPQLDGNAYNEVMGRLKV